jgi:hypothetical protein
VDLHIHLELSKKERQIGESRNVTSGACKRSYIVNCFRLYWEYDRNPSLYFKVRRLPRVSLESTPQEDAERASALYSSGIICSGEVWGKFVEFVTPENVEACLSFLPDELQTYFRDTSLTCTLADCKTEQQQHGLLVLQNWYRTHEIA